jgi:hypothetical protein
VGEKFISIAAVCDIAADFGASPIGKTAENIS